MPVQKLTMTATEKAALQDALAYFETFGAAGAKVIKGLTSLLAKVDKAESRSKAPAGMSLADVENALCAGAGQKYACWVAGNPSACLKSLHNVGATRDQLVLVGRWLTYQDWMRGQCALPTIVKNWAGWLAKATAENLQGPKLVVRDAKPAGFE